MTVAPRKEYANAGKLDDGLNSNRMALLMAESEYVGAGYRARLHYNIGVCHFRMNDFEIATKHFKSALILKGDFAPAYHALGMTRTRHREQKARTGSL